MKIQIASIAHRDPPWLESAIGAYESRLPRYWNLQFTTLKPQAADSQSLERYRADEWERLKTRLNPGVVKIALDETGESWDSSTLAKRLNTWQEEQFDVAFIIGGAEGLAPECRATADKTWSLSKLTFPHQFVKLILVEQLYRAHTILQGHPYHRG